MFEAMNLNLQILPKLFILQIYVDCIEPFIYPVLINYLSQPQEQTELFLTFILIQ